MLADANTVEWQRFYENQSCSFKFFVNFNFIKSCQPKVFSPVRISSFSQLRQFDFYTDLMSQLTVYCTNKTGSS